MYFMSLASLAAIFLSPHQSLQIAPKASLDMKEGYIPFVYEGETHRTYYKAFGDIDNRTRTPVVVLHGGPGMSHDYVLPHADLAGQGFPVIFYDQLCNARSTHLPDKPLTFWTIDLFLDELDSVLQHFGIQDAFHIVGHSWGGMMAAEYVVRRHPAGLKRLVIADAPAAITLWRQSFKDRLETFPKEIRDAVGRDPEEDRKAFYDAVMQVYAVYGCRVQPFPEDFVRSMQYSYGDGADFTLDKADILKDWSIVDRAHMINVPTLLVNGQYDIAQDYVMAAYDKIPESSRAKFENSSHTPFWEERKEYMEVVGRFLGV